MKGLSKSYTDSIFYLVEDISGESNANVKKALEGSDTEAIKSATEKLTTAFYSVSEKLYNQAREQAGDANTQSEGPQTDENGNVYNADYKVEDDNGENK